MTNFPAKMKAPQGCTAMQADGVEYTVPKNGVVKVLSEGHVPILRRHGFTDHFEEPADLEKQIDEMDDKDELVEFIEERAGEADTSMGMKKLKRLAREAAGLKD